MRKSVALLLVLSFLTASSIVIAKSASSAEAEFLGDYESGTAGETGSWSCCCYGKIYVIGGTYEGYHNTNQEYDPSTNTWAVKTSMPTPRSNFGIAVYQNKIYCIGGSPGSDWTVG